MQLICQYFTPPKFFHIRYLHVHKDSSGFLTRKFTKLPLIGKQSIQSTDISVSAHKRICYTYILNNSKDSYHTITHNVTLNITYYFITTSSHNVHHNTAILVIIVSTEPISEQHANQLPCATLQCQVIDDKCQIFILIIMERLLFAPCIQMPHLSFTSLQCGRLKE